MFTVEGVSNDYSIYVQTECSTASLGNRVRIGVFCPIKKKQNITKINMILGSYVPVEEKTKDNNNIQKHGAKY